MSELSELRPFGALLRDPGHAERTFMVRDHHVDELLVNTRRLCDLDGGGLGHWGS